MSVSGPLDSIRSSSDLDQPTELTEQQYEALRPLYETVNGTSIVRRRADLSSPEVARIPAGTACYVVQTCRLADGTERACIVRANPDALQEFPVYPLGWVTQRRKAKPRHASCATARGHCDFLVQARVQPGSKLTWRGTRNAWSPPPRSPSPTEPVELEAIDTSLRQNGAGRLDAGHVGDRPSAEAAHEAASLKAARAARRAARSAPAAPAPPPRPPLTASTLRAQLLTSGPLMQLFKRWDADKSGKVTREEFRAELVATDIAAADDDMDAIFDEMDTDGSGSIKLSELYEWVHPPEQPPKLRRAGRDAGNDRRKKV